MKKSQTRAIAFSGIMSALCVSLLYIGSVVEVLDYTVSAFCGILVTLVIVEFGDRAGVGVWLVSSILAILLLPTKISSLLFVVFCGWYSFAKRALERLPAMLCLILKFLLFNVVLSVIYVITVKVLLIEAESPLIITATLILSNFVFFIYDILITKVIFLYVHKFRKRLTFLKK